MLYNYLKKYSILLNEEHLSIRACDAFVHAIAGSCVCRRSQIACVGRAAFNTVGLTSNPLRLKGSRKYQEEVLQ